MAPRETHSIPILSGLPLPPLPSLRARPTHVPVRETRSACHCLARRALDLPQRIEHFPEFLSADRVEKRDAVIFLEEGKKKKNIPLTIHVVYSGYVLCRPQRCSNSSASVRVYLKKRETRPNLSVVRRALSIPRSLIPQPPPPRPLAARGRAPFRNLPMAKGRFEDCARLASNPRFLSLNLKARGKKVYRTTLPPANVVCSYRETAYLCVRRST